MTASIIAIVITYHPPENCIRNILTYYDEVSQIILVDNTEHENSRFIESLSSYEKITILKKNINLGIGKAINLAMEKLLSTPCDYILTMDQDSWFAENEFARYVSCIQTLNISTLGMVGINYEQTKKENNTGCTPKEASSLITSGSVFPLQAYKTVGKFNEDLFIDGVDHEYCLRLHQQKLQVIWFPEIYLNHNLGTKKEMRNLGIGKKRLRHIHSPVRLYYITRNYLYLNRIYGKEFPAFCKKLKKEIWVKLKNGILYEEGKMKYIKYFFKGLGDFRKSRFGPL